MKELEEYKHKNDPKKLFKTAKNLMGTPNFNKGAYLIHNNQQIHDNKAQADIFADTWEDIMTQNIVRPDDQFSNIFRTSTYGNSPIFSIAYHTIPLSSINWIKTPPLLPQ